MTQSTAGVHGTIHPQSVDAQRKADCAACRMYRSKAIIDPWVGAFLIVLIFWAGTPAIAGVLLAPSLKWDIFAFEPESSENTPNYQGITGELKAGYSYRQVFDFAGLFSYSAGNPGIFSIPDENANFIFYGGEVAARIHQAVYFALRGGSASYQLLQPGAHDNEVLGKWTGPAFGFSLGGISPFSRSKVASFQVSIDFMQTIVEKMNAIDGESKTRKVDQFSISATYVFNGYNNAVVENSFFSSYLNSFIFWE